MNKNTNSQSEETLENIQGDETKKSQEKPQDNQSSTEESSQEPQVELSKEEQLEIQLAETKDKWLRAHAELENLRKRTIREKKEATQYAVTNFARDMLEVSDNFRRALLTLPEDIAEDDAMNPFIEGVKMTEQQLISIFTRHKIEEIDAENKQFDPNLHQAMFEMPNTDVPNNTITQVVQAGFTISGRLLRPAMVGVAKGGPTSTPTPNDVNEEV